MIKQHTQTLTLLVLGALLFAPMGCDLETGDDNYEVEEVEREAEITTDAMAEAELLATEAREAGTDVEGYVCLYAEAPEIMEACAQRASKTESQLVPELDVVAPASADAWTCEGKCGTWTGECGCDWACYWIFGDCCWDYLIFCD